MKRRFALRVGGLLLGTGAAVAPLGGLALHAWVGARAALSAGLGAALATVVALATIGLWTWAIDKPAKTFLAAVAGGFLGRMALFVGAIIFLVTGTELPPAPFVGGLFAYYLLYQILEIRALPRLAGIVGSRVASR